MEPESHWGTLQHAIDASGLNIKTSIWPSTDPGCYTDLFRNLAAVIKEGAEMEVRWEEATAVIEIIELAKKSVREGKSVDVPY